MTGVQCIAVILLTRVVQQYTNKRASMLLPVTVYGNARYFTRTNAFAALFAFILLICRGELSDINLPTVLFASISGVMLVVASVCTLYAIKSGTMALSSMFATAGVLVPCIAGIFLYGETVRVLQWIGVLVFLVSSYLLIGASKQTNAGFSLKTVLLLIGSLLSNGITMLVQTIFAREVENGSVAAFSFLSFMIPTALLLLMLCVLKCKTPQPISEKISGKLMITAIVSATAVFIVNQFATMAAKLVQPVILFTFINGGNTIIAALMAALFFKERFTVKSTLGILLGVVALVMIKAF